MTLRQLADRPLKTKLLALAVTTTSIFAAAATTARADVSNAATCRFRTHLQLDSGSYRTTDSSIACMGTLAGQLVSDSDSLMTWGHYVESSSAQSGCIVAWRDGVFYARIGEALRFDDHGYVVMIGGFAMSGSPVMKVTGTGDSSNEPVLEAGTATFTPDPGQSCGSLHSGTLTQRVTFVDGGTGNPAAAAAVYRYEAPETVSQPSTASQAAYARQTARPRRPHHRHPHRREGHPHPRH